MPSAKRKGSWSPERWSPSEQRGGRLGKNPTMTRRDEAKDRELWSEDLNWFLNMRDADCGVRSNLASVVASIERGGVGGSGAYDKYHRGQVDVGPSVSHTAFSRDRKMRRRWLALDGRDRDLFAWHYTGHARVENRNAKAEPMRSRWPLGVDSQLGMLAGACWYQAQLDGTVPLLLDACEFRRKSLIDKALEVSAREVRQAHRRYYAIVEAEKPEERPSTYASEFAADAMGDSRSLSEALWFGSVGMREIRGDED